MIIKMSQRANGRQLAKHLVSDENERVSVISTNGVLSQHVAGAIAEFEAIAKGSRARKPLAHCMISPHPVEEMTPEKWMRAWQLFAKTHGLEGRQCIIIEHHKNGRTHQHAVFNRVDFETGKALNMGHTHRKNELISRLLELEFGHKLVKGKQGLRGFVWEESSSKLINYAAIVVDSPML